MQKLYTFILFAVTASSYSQQQWRPLGPDDYNQAFYNQADDYELALNGNNTPYVAFIYPTDTDNSLSVRKFVNGHWEFVGPDDFTDGYEWDIAFTIDNNNVPYVGYNVNTTFYVKKFDGINWVSVGTFNYVCKSGKLAVDAQNNLYLAGTFGAGVVAGLKKFDGTNWIAVGDAAISTGGSTNVAVEFSSSDVPYIAYTDSNAGLRLSVKKLVGTTWQLVGSNNISADEATGVSLALNSNDEPFVSFTNEPNVGPDENKVLKFNGTTWQNVGASLTSDQPLQLAIDDNNTVYITRRVSYQTYVDHYNGAQWLITGNYFFGIPRALIFGSNATPYVLFSNDINLAVNKLNGSVWERIGETDIAEKGNGTLSAHMYATHDHELYYAYANEHPSKVAVKKWENGQWTPFGQAFDYTDSPTKIRLTEGPGNQLFLFYKASESLQVKKYNGSAWTDAAPPLSYGSYQNSAIADDGTIYVTGGHFIQGGQMLIRSYKYNGSAWVTLPDMNFNTQSNAWPYLEVYNGSLYIAYQESVNGKIKVKRLNGNTWQAVGPEDGVSTGGAIVPYLKKSTDGLYLTYSDENDYKISVQKYDGTSWQFIGEDGFSEGVSSALALSFDNNNVPYVGYISATGHTAVMKFASGEWINVGETIAASHGGITDFWTNIAFLANNVPVVGYAQGGVYAKYFGEAAALSTPNFATGKDNSRVIYPNPAHDAIYVSYTGAAAGELYDLMGKKVFAGSFTGNKLEMPAMKGLYILKIYNTDGTITTKKIELK